MSIRPVINSQVAIARTTEVTAERARDIRQTGLTSGTLNEIVRDTEEEMRSVRDKAEVESPKVRTDEDGKNNSGQGGGKKKKKPAPGEPGGNYASSRLLNLPVTNAKELESRGFDIKV